MCDFYSVWTIIELCGTEEQQISGFKHNTRLYHDFIVGFCNDEKVQHADKTGSGLVGVTELSLNHLHAGDDASTGLENPTIQMLKVTLGFDLRFTEPVFVPLPVKCR